MKVLPSPQLIPSSMNAGNNITASDAGGAGPGSASVMPLPPVAGAVLPLPSLGPPEPVNPQAGHGGGAGLSSSLPHVPEGGSDGAPWPAGDQGIDAGPWKKTQGFS
jgi:hypothetical protein